MPTRLKKILVECAQQFKEIHGIILLGSFLGKREPKLFCFSPDLFCCCETIEDAYRALQANVRPKPKTVRPQDVDIWLLVEGSCACPNVQTIDKAQRKFLNDVLSNSYSERGTLSAQSIDQLKKKHFCRFYKQKQYYTGFLKCEDAPWEGGCYTRTVKSEIKRKGIELPCLEIRAFPASVFHLRPHAIVCGGYPDRRLPMAFNLSDWLKTTENYDVLYRTKQAQIWPFVPCARPQGLLW